ncbi:MAG: NmrA/HSCARG family protein [Phenylobacterium sp.]|jgi:uncharacterized protein YbjT (DUF2867 family)
MTFAVLGATGGQGGAVVRALLSRGQAVRALTRRPESAAALALAREGVEVVQADLDHPESLPPALRGCSGVFSVQDFYAPGVGLAGEIRQGRALIAAARSAGVPHIVQSTMGDGRTPGGPAHFLSKAVLEQDLRKSGLGWTFLGTVWFLDNLLNPAMHPSLIFPVLSGSLEPSTPFQMLALEDLGWVAAEALGNPDAWVGRKINLAGDVLSVVQMKHAYRQAAGRRPKSWSMPAPLFRRMAPEFAAQLKWHNEVGFAFDAKPLRGLKPYARTFFGFIEEAGIRTL